MNINYTCQDKTNHNRIVVIQTAGQTQTFSGLSTAEKITLFNNVKRDNFNQWDNTNSRFTAKFDGNYSVNIKLNFFPSSNTGIRVINLYKNGSIFINLAITHINSSSANTFYSLNGSTELGLKEGDYLEFFVFSTNNPDTTNNDPNFNQLTISQLSAA